MQGAFSQFLPYVDPNPLCHDLYPVIPNMVLANLLPIPRRFLAHASQKSKTWFWVSQRDANPDVLSLYT